MSADASRGTGSRKEDDRIAAKLNIGFKTGSLLVGQCRIACDLKLCADKRQDRLGNVDIVNFLLLKLNQ